MKKLLSMLVCVVLILMLVISCTTSDKTETTDQTVPGDLFSKVFDTSDDAGKMTARFLYLTEQHPASPKPIRTGDSAVYTSPEGLIMLVDCGNPSSGKEVVTQLQAMGVKTIDIFVASHVHADHIGGFSAIAQAFEIKQVYMNQHDYDTETFWTMMKIIEEKKIPYTRLCEGDEFMFGKQVYAKVYNPPADFDYANAIATAAFISNNASLCIKMTYKDSSFLTAGDMYIESEEEMTLKYGNELQADIVKMNHHGDSSSNLTEYIQALQPKVAVALNEGIISLVVNMRYQNAGAITFYNCTDGAVKVSTTGDGTYEVQSQIIRELTSIGSPDPNGFYRV